MCHGRYQNVNVVFWPTRGNYDTLRILLWRIPACKGFLMPRFFYFVVQKFGKLVGKVKGFPVSPGKQTLCLSDIMIVFLSFYYLILLASRINRYLADIFLSTDLLKTCLHLHLCSLSSQRVPGHFQKCFGQCSPSSVFLSPFTPVLWCGKALSLIAIFCIEISVAIWNQMFTIAGFPSKTHIFDGNPKVIIQEFLNITQNLEGDRKAVSKR